MTKLTFLCVNQSSTLRSQEEKLENQIYYYDLRENNHRILKPSFIFIRINAEC